MKKIIFILAFLWVNQLFSQDSIKIRLQPAGVNMWYSESIVLSKHEFYFCKYWVQDEAPRIKIKLNRYPNFLQFLKDSISSKNLSLIKKERTPRERQMDTTCEASYDLIFSIYKGKKMETYGFRLYSDCKLEYSNSPIFDKITTFWKDFFREHGCEKPYIIHEVKAKETYESICKSYQMDTFVVMMYNAIYEDELGKINRKDFEYPSVEDGKPPLKTGDKILIPCLPQKVSDYE